MTDETDPFEREWNEAAGEDEGFTDDDVREHFGELVAEGDALFLVALRYGEITDEDDPMLEKHDDAEIGDEYTAVGGGRSVFDRDGLSEREQARLMLDLIEESREQLTDIDPRHMFTMLAKAGELDTETVEIADMGEFLDSMAADADDDADDQPGIY